MNKNNSTKPRPSGSADTPSYSILLLLLILLSAAASVFVYLHGHTLYYGDAEAHLNIARRWLDSRTPGPEQLGTVWLPLPHLLMTPLVMNNFLWRSGIAGVIPSAACFVIAGAFLFASSQRIFENAAASWAALAVFALNPNMLYLQAIPMTEAVMAAAIAALLWATLSYRDSYSPWAMLAASAASIAASLTRYEGWFLIPFVALFFLLFSKRHAFAFAALAALGPLSWIAHNRFYWSDALAFFHGPYSALAIYHKQLAQGMARYPGDHHWLQAVHYYFAAVRWTIGWPCLILGAIGFIMAIFRPRLWWPLALLALSPIFYVLSMHSSGTPIYVPDLWPFSWYNTRYGLAALPFMAIAIGSLVDLTGKRSGLAFAAAVALLAAFTPTAICWKESEVNSVARREWTRQAADYLRANHESGSGIIYTFGDLTGVLREAGISLHDGLHQDNRQAWDAAVIRPELFLHEKWALAVEGDPVDLAIARVQRYGLRYDLVKRVTVKDAPAIDIYQRKELGAVPPGSGKILENGQ